MAQDKEIWGVAVGPFIVGGVETSKPRTRADRRWSLVIWILVIACVAPASPMLGVILILGTAMVLAAATAPQQGTDTKEIPHERFH